LRDATEQMRGEILTLNRLLEPLHAVAEERERQRRDHAAELDRLGEETRLALQRRDEETQQLRARLLHVYASRSWWLTKPWRYAGRLLRRFAR
jgi:hypothetical protein